MSLKDIKIKHEYRSLLDNIGKEFYVPLLGEAISYKRAVGFFSSSALIEISKGISSLVSNGGKIELIASPYLSDEDIEAISNGYERKTQIIEKALIKELHVVTNKFEKERLNLLANLIADGVLDIKIALTEQNGNIGMYHEKMGIISDSEGNKVAFSGSMNESMTAMSINYEAIDVFCSWNDSEGRVSSKVSAFSSIWNNNEPNVETIEFPELSQAIIQRYRVSKPNFQIDELENCSENEKQSNTTKIATGPRIPDNVILHDYQVSAIDKWEKYNFCGIFDMATGTGKTFTGLGAASRLSEYLDDKLAIFIVCPYQHLVEQWVEDIRFFGINPIIGYSASNQKDWKKRLDEAILDQKLKVKNRDFFCFVTTNATFASEFVQSKIMKLRSNSLLIVDEAHNFGAEYLSKTLNDKFAYKLALSATLDRHNDEEGTQRLFNYFGNKCIEYTLDEAIDEGKLTKYKYYPILCTLSEIELQKYSEISYEIGKCLIKSKSGKIKLNEKGKRLALARARLVAGAEDKIIKLKEIIENYQDEKHILVYCGATRILGEKQEFSDIDEEDLRQIDVVTNILGNELNMKVSQFTSKEDMQEREILKKEFSTGENLQVLIAIKCLDEGVNIPKIKTAFILASTTNPKEYIQRRGRVLRLAVGKEFAEIYDFVILPRELNGVHSLTEDQMKKDVSLVKNELKRVVEFSRIAMNQTDSQIIVDDIKDAYDLRDDDIIFEEDFNYE